MVTTEMFTAEGGPGNAPTAEDEAAFLAEQGEAVPVPRITAEPVAAEPLPPLDELVARIPAEARQLMEELFRAKFVTVKRVPGTALKNS